MKWHQEATEQLREAGIESIYVAEHESYVILVDPQLSAQFCKNFESPQAAVEAAKTGYRPEAVHDDYRLYGEGSPGWTLDDSDVIGGAFIAAE